MSSGSSVWNIAALSIARAAFPSELEHAVINSAALTLHRGDCRRRAWRNGRVGISFSMCALVMDERDGLRVFVCEDD